MATPTTGASGCNANLAGDSYVPSNNQNPSPNIVISCTVNSGNVGNATTCSAGLSTTLNGCSGCMDST